MLNRQKSASPSGGSPKNNINKLSGGGKKEIQ